MKSNTELRKIIKEKPLLFDGAFGTYFAQKNPNDDASLCERFSIDRPQLIKAIHSDYLRAGSEAIRSNTYQANRNNFSSDHVKRIISASLRIAKEVAEPYDAFVFADIGPIKCNTIAEATAEYKFMVDAMLEEGADKFVFETLADISGIIESARYIKSKNPDAFIIVSFAVLPEGYTREGIFGAELLEAAAGSGVVDVAGYNCGSGIRQMHDLIRDVSYIDIPFFILPNAGYPIVIHNRTFYDSDPDYFGEKLAHLVKHGGVMLGGCCGTTPKHIESARKALEGAGLARVRVESKVKEEKEHSESPFIKKLKLGLKPIAVELDPPENFQIGKYMDGVEELKAAGTDIITIADCPIARARMDSSLLACKLKRDLGMEAIPHMTCRDRNLNATKGLLFGLSAEEINNVLVVTGDPIPVGERDEVKSVYQFNSRKMTAFINALSKNGQVTPFNIFGALNVNALNFDIELKRTKEKIEKGMIGFFTQPVLSESALENIKRAYDELDAYIIGGIMPVVSERNARFMDNEISGINVDEEIIKLYEGLDRMQAEELAVRISVKIAKKIAPYIHGYYLMTPFGRTGLMNKIIKKINA